MIKETIDLLGHKAVDAVTGFEGVIASVCFDLYGCVQAVLTPPAKDGKLGEGKWFDVQRLKVSDEKVDVPIPDFEAMTAIVPSTFTAGPAEKSVPERY